MIEVHVVVGMFIALAAICGMMRGSAKEILVTAAVVLGLFIITILETYADPISALLKSAKTEQPAANTILSIRLIIFALAAFFGYQTPAWSVIRDRGQGRLAANRMQNSLLGFGLGLVNGYLIAGSAWWFIDNARYPFPALISPVISATGAAAVAFLPPLWLMTVPLIFVAVAVALGIVLIVFL